MTRVCASCSKAPGIFVDTVAPGGVAARNGTLRVGDRVLAADGYDLFTASRPMALSVRVVV